MRVSPLRPITRAQSVCGIQILRGTSSDLAELEEADRDRFRRLDAERVPLRPLLSLLTRPMKGELRDRERPPL